eukprot:6640405-Karenia_brevis.AAC.1
MSWQKPGVLRMLQVVEDNQLPAFMRLKQWPSAENNPTIGVQLDYQTQAQPGCDASIAELVWQQGQVS